MQSTKKQTCELQCVCFFDVKNIYEICSKDLFDTITKSNNDSYGEESTMRSNRSHIITCSSKLSDMYIGTLEWCMAVIFFFQFSVVASLASIALNGDKFLEPA
jgi:hypothetical protein